MWFSGREPPVVSVEDGEGGFVVRTADDALAARRIILAGGVWLGTMARWFGLELPIACRVNQGTITERMRPILNTVLEVYGRLSLKQAANGTVLMGTVLHWIDDPDRGAELTDPLRLVARMAETARSAAAAVPALAGGRVVRTWTGLEGYTPDNLPVFGPLPGIDHAYVMGCMRSGFTAGPVMGRLLADAILGREPELPIFTPAFDPARLGAMKWSESALAQLEFA